MKMKKICSLILAASMAVSLCACGSSSSSSSAAGKASSAADSTASTGSTDTSGLAAKAGKDPAVKLVYAEVDPKTSLPGQVGNYFQNEVKKLSGGSVTIDVQYSGVLGAEGDVLDTMLGGGGTIDMARISTSSLTNYGVKLTNLLSCPYLFKDRTHFWKFADSDLGKKILNEPEDLGLGIRGLCYYEEGFRDFFFKQKVSSMSDLKGKKIRVSTDPTMTSMVKNLGASPTVVAFTELYSSLSSGVVDAAEQPIANYQANAFNEVAPYLMLDQHTLGIGEIITTNAAWEKLTDNQKEAIKEASANSSKYDEKLSTENEEKCIKDLKAKGVTFIEVKDQQKWKDACASTIKSVTKGMESQYDQISKMAS